MYSAKQTIAFVTYSEAPELTVDDSLVLPFLTECNIEVVPAVWDDPAVRWDAFDAIIVRSCWDYHFKEQEFRRWIKHCKTSGWNVWNPVEILSWNMRKNYLQDLAQLGIRIPATVWYEQPTAVDLQGVLRTTGWNRAVIKPVIAATAYRTWLTKPHNAREIQARLDEILRSTGAMVQEYLPEVAEAGEWSFVFFNKQFSHAVKKRVRPGDFRVQSRFGGTVVSETPPPELVDQAEAVVQNISTPLLYARVDGIDRGGEFFLLELELIEPVLFLGADPSAPQAFASAIQTILGVPKRNRP